MSSRRLTTRTRRSPVVKPPARGAPHLGGDGMGAKFEDAVVTDDNAGWRDEELPHAPRRRRRRLR